MGACCPMDPDRTATWPTNGLLAWIHKLDHAARNVLMAEPAGGLRHRRAHRVNRSPFKETYVHVCT